MKFVERFDKQLSYFQRTIISALIAPVMFYFGLYKFNTNQILMPFWQRDYSNITHGFFNFGHAGSQSLLFPSALVMLITAGLIITMIYKSILLYPKNLSLHFIFLLIIDSLAVSTVVNIFIFSGGGSEIFYYVASFAAGAYLFSSTVISRNALFIIVVLLMVRILFVEELYFYAKLIPPLLLIYIFIRAPVDSFNFTKQFQNISFNMERND